MRLFLPSLLPFLASSQAPLPPLIPVSDMSAPEKHSDVYLFGNHYEQTQQLPSLSTSSSIASALSTLDESTATLRRLVDNSSGENFAADAVSACASRTAALKSLLSLGSNAAAVDGSFRLSAEEKSALPCSFETNFDGLATVYTQVRTPTMEMEERRQLGGVMGMDMRTVVQSVVLPSGERFRLSAYGDSIFQRTTSNVPLHGFILDGTFYSLDSTLRCDASGLKCHDGTSWKSFTSLDDVVDRRQALFNAVNAKSFDETAEEHEERKLQDGVHNDWTTGTKSVLLVVVCYEGLDCTDRETAMAGDLDVSSFSTFEDDLRHEMGLFEDFFSQQSFGKTPIDVTEVPGLIILPNGHMSADFCQRDPSGNDLDHLGTIFQAILAQVETEHPSVGDTSLYDYPLVLSPNCNQADPGWAGIAYAGYKNSWVRIGSGGSSNGRVIAHEIGHNFGNQHDSFGATEYGNPFSVMGHGEIPQGHFLGGAKFVFNWLDHNDHVLSIGRADSGTTHCGRTDLNCDRMNVDEPKQVTLQPIDDSVLTDDRPALVRVFTDHPTRFYWLEWRSQFNGGGLMISWAPVFALQGGGGILGYSNLVNVHTYTTPSSWQFEDKLETPATEVLSDSYLKAGETYVIDLDEIGLAVEVHSIDPISREMSATLTYKQLGSNNHDEEALVMSNGSDGVCLSNNEVPLNSGEVVRMAALDDGDEGETVRVDFSGFCARDTDDAKFYVYKEYPVGATEYGANPSIGALHVASVPLCGGESGGGDYCVANGGVQVTVGYGNVDGWFAYEETEGEFAPYKFRNADYGVSVANVAPGTWAIVTDGGGYYDSRDCGVDIVSSNYPGFVEVWNSCYVAAGFGPNMVEVACSSPTEFSVSMGTKKSSIREIVWDTYSAPFFVFMPGEGIETEGAVTIECDSLSHFCSEGEYLNPTGECLSCPSGTYTFTCRDSEACCQPCPGERAYFEYETNHCHNCPEFQHNPDPSMNTCVDDLVCEEGYSKHRFTKRRDDQCQTIAYNGGEHAQRLSAYSHINDIAFVYSGDPYFDFTCARQDPTKYYCLQIPKNQGHLNAWYQRIECLNGPVDNVLTAYEDCDMASHGTDWNFAKDISCSEDGWSGSAHTIADGEGNVADSGMWVSGFEEVSEVCLKDGVCYSFSAQRPSPWKNTTVMECFDADMQVGYGNIDCVLSRTDTQYECADQDARLWNTFDDNWIIGPKSSSGQYFAFQCGQTWSDHDLVQLWDECFTPGLTGAVPNLQPLGIIPKACVKPDPVDYPGSVSFQLLSGDGAVLMSGSSLSDGAEFCTEATEVTTPLPTTSPTNPPEVPCWSDADCPEPKTCDNGEKEERRLRSGRLRGTSWTENYLNSKLHKRLVNGKRRLFGMSEDDDEDLSPRVEGKCV